MSKIKRGDAVEFSLAYHQHYVMGGEYALFGIATEAERGDGSVTVERGDGTTFHARYIHAFGWIGWISAELEDAQERLSPYSEPYSDGDYGY
jgi:hypothetical protein